MGVVQNQQGSDVEETAQCFDGAADQAEDQSQQRDISVYRFKQDIEERHLRDLTGHFNEVDRESQLKQVFVCQNIGCGSRSITVYNDPAADAHLGNDAGSYDDQI